eukprot:CAMPEP_0201910780 /NCGR_PEP_ID=MMETSP0903-20130614/2022_1 /ASSEMBLY_ACC=CAM_ASM_000552 /TAXON_ID=420261 /ORGANISM="Thalassiosira antarctica, Strain CCMP982" /LENGTH=769 /DNA_ID=CAMNT_0048445455 /DNA_START=278 /DNA_END=2587 /DNA_ORIENTATION=-
MFLKLSFACSVLSLLAALGVGASATTNHNLFNHDKDDRLFETERTGELATTNHNMFIHDDKNGRPFETERAGELSTVQCVVDDISKTFTECCPSADSSDAICTLLWYFAGQMSSAGYGRCDCGKFEGACDDIGSIKYLLVPIFGDVCSKVDECCVDGTTTNNEFNMCMIDAIEDGDISFPDSIESITPDVDDIPVVGKSLQCIAEDISKTFTECCPSADSSDAICALLWCFDLDLEGVPTTSYRCNCVEIEDVCNEVEMFMSMATLLLDECSHGACDAIELFMGFLGEVCSQVGECCEDDTSTKEQLNACTIKAVEGGGDGATTNEEFKMCMIQAVKDGDITAPDLFVSLLPDVGEVDLTTATTTKKPTLNPTKRPTGKPTNNPTEPTNSVTDGYCDACSNTCAFWELNCLADLVSCKIEAAVVKAFKDTVETICSDDPSRMDARDLLNDAKRILIETELFSSDELDPVNIHFCSDLGEWNAADGMAPSKEKVLLDTSFIQAELYPLTRLLAHEFFHIRQYHRWGSEGFDCRYAGELKSGNGFGRDNYIEKEAYEFTEGIAENVIADWIWTNTVTSSSSPMKSPTVAPTKEPTTNPTDAPSSSLMKSPIAPTKEPTNNPIGALSSIPMKYPTIAPTKEPTSNRTDAPSSSPMKSPTIASPKDPTSNPPDALSSSPTKYPTFLPPAEPTNTPTYTTTQLAGATTIAGPTEQATDNVDSTTTITTSTVPSDATGPTDPDGSKEPYDENDAKKYVAKVFVYLIGPSITMVFI